MKFSRNKLSILALIIMVAILVVEGIFIFRNKIQEEPESKIFTKEEKINILNKLEASSRKTGYTSEEKKQMLEDLAKQSPPSQILTPEEKMKKLNDLKKL